MKMFQVLVMIGLGAFVSGCATTSFEPDKAPEFVITKDLTPFYLIGPMQKGGADASLPLDTRVKRLTEEMGFSRVVIPDGRAGYVANESMAPAPPQPPAASPDDEPPSSRRRRGGGGARYTGAQVNDTPLPNIPPPDLNIAPEDISAPPPTPTPAPEPPKFRF